jgi:hypothetical protein
MGNSPKCLVIDGGILGNRCVGGIARLEGSGNIGNVGVLFTYSQTKSLGLTVPQVEGTACALVRIEISKSPRLKIKLRVKMN